MLDSSPGQDLVAREERMIQSPIAVMATLAGVCAFYFWLAKTTQWKLFKYIVPLIWIYATPIFLRNFGVLPSSSSSYDVLRQYALPAFIVMLLLSVNVGAAVRIMGKTMNDLYGDP